MAVLYAQTALATPFANSAAVAPQAALALSRALAAEMVKQEQQQVEKTEKTDPPLVADRQGEKRKPPFGGRRARRMTQARRPDEETPPPISPLVGNLLNMKV
jgi:hypothetical protein